MSDLSRAEKEIDWIPESLYLFEKFPEEIYTHFVGVPSIPVLNLSASEEKSWSEEDLLFALAHYQSENRKSENRAQMAAKSEQPSGIEKDKDSTEWLSRLVLSAMPYPLFAADLKGHTLFYNELFEKKLLDGESFNRSIATAESYLREILTDFLARAAASGEPTESISVLLDRPPFYLRIQAIENQGKIIGYLYLFREVDSIFAEISSAITERRSLNELLERFEAGIIGRVLKENGFNVSHSAKALGLRRSTLQNRIRILEIDKRFSIKPEGPIRRTRKIRIDTNQEERTKILDNGSVIKNRKESKTVQGVPEKSRKPSSTGKKIPAVKKSSRSSISKETKVRKR